MPVHPRVRGEHAIRDEIEPDHDGSSPRARGTPRSCARCGEPRRFIPACAGNTYSGESFTPPESVHPRVRGEHLTNTLLSQGRDGSSPRARGTPGRSHRADSRTRFIPACAGNTTGELYASSIEHGSSPRARGTPCIKANDEVENRFIPACAGNTRSTCTTSASPAVHPRVRGEHSGACFCARDQAGSSPRARGTPINAVRTAVEGRFIPACAGNTASNFGTAFRNSVHPRVRGEHQLQVGYQGMVDGSSPRARGTPVRAPQARAAPRFIPACAGNTPPCCRRA